MRPQPHKRLATGAVLLMVGLLVVRLAWGYVASSRLQREFHAIVAAGDPVTVEGLKSPSIADSLNAVPVIRDAIAALAPAVASPAESNMVYDDAPPYPPAWHRMAERAVAANAASLGLARAARARPEFDWAFPLESPLFRHQPKSLNDGRRLANLVADAAVHAHVHADDAEAIERARDVLHLSTAYDHQPFLVAHLVSIGLEALATHRLMVMAPGLTVAGMRPPPGPAPAPAPATAATRPTPRPAERDQVRAVIDALLDERGTTERLRRAFAVERVARLDTMAFLTRHARLLRPMYDLDAARTPAADRVRIRAATMPSWPAAQEVLVTIPSPGAPIDFGLGPLLGGLAPEPDPRPPRFSRMLGAFFSQGLERVVQTHMQQRSHRRATAIALAVRLYHAEHEAWPASLDVLVPRYLPRVPADPFAADERPMRYLLLEAALPDGRDRPIVYTVALNGADETATARDIAAVLPAEPNYGWRSPSSGEIDDQWFDLARWTTAQHLQRSQTDNREDEPKDEGFDPSMVGELYGGLYGDPPSTQAVEDEPQEADDPRHDDEGDGGARVP